MNKKNLVFPGVAVAILVATISAGALSSIDQQRTLDKTEAEIVSLTEQIALAEETAVAASTEATLAATGADSNRLASDEEQIADLLEASLKWSDHASYQEAREKVMRVYGLAADSTYMTTFLPEAPVTVDGEGNEYPYIDSVGLNSSLGSLEVRLLGVDGLTYRYMVLAEAKTSSTDNQQRASNTSVVLLSTDETGALLDIRGFAATETPMRSGS